MSSRAFRAPLVAQLIKDSAAKGVKASLPHSPPASPSSAPGRAGTWRREVQRLAQATGVRVIGPNCLGIHSPKAGFSFAPDLPRETGPVSFICQSGGNTCTWCGRPRPEASDSARSSPTAMPADIDETDLLEYFRQDEKRRWWPPISRE